MNDSTKQNGINAVNPSAKLKHNKFVTFWLWLGAIVNAITTIVYFLLLFSSKGLWTATPEPTSSKIVWVLQSAALVIGYVLLLKWRKVGFYIIAAMAMLTIILNLLTSEISIMTFSSIIPIVILYLMLQLKKNEVSYWEIMDKKISNNYSLY